MSGGSERYREYIVAALLHDVGKLIRRAKLCSGESARRHVEHSIEFVEYISGVLRSSGLDVDLVRRLVEMHHEGGYGIAPYDRAAAMERQRGDEESGGGLAMPDRGEHQIPLIIYKATGGETLKEMYVPPCPLPQSISEAERLKPCEDAACLPPERVCQCYQESYRELMRLADELNRLEMSYMQLMETLVHILRATASFVPVAVYGVSKPDTSLFAHSILAAALASTGGEFYLVSIDVGRIQEYISRAKTATWAMSILRGRSLRITMLQKLAARRLMEELNRALGGDVVTHANILIDSGGEVLLLVPRVEGFEKIIERIEDEVLRETEGQMALYINYSGPYRLEQIGQFNDLVRELTLGTMRRKLKFKLYPTPAAAGNAQSKRGFYQFHSDTCDFCGRPAKTRLVENTLNLCNMCAEEYHVGKAARNLRAIVVKKDQVIEGDRLKSMRMLGYTVVFAGGEYDLKPVAGVAGGGSMYTVNTRRFIHPAPRVAYGFLYTNQHIPEEEWGVASLEELEKAAVFVRMDANSMGKRKAAASERPSLLVTFSTTVSMVYELYSALLADTERYRESVYVIYSGGDDAILVGDLSAVGYASKLAEYAKAWGFHTAIGVKVASYHYPVYYAFMETEERLERAKEVDRNRSVAVFSEDPLLYIVAEKLREVYNAVEGITAVDWGFEKAQRLERAIRIIYAKLFDIRKAAELCTKNPKNQLVARRIVAKALIELAYIVNRRGLEGLETALDLTGDVARPEKFGAVYAPVLKCAGELQELKEEFNKTIVELNKAIIALNLLHLKSKSE